MFQGWLLFFDGNQETRERASGAPDAKLQSNEDAHKLRGVLPAAADWHTLVTFYQVLYSVHAFVSMMWV